MTSLNDDGLRIDSQDLGIFSPTSDDHGRLFNHDGSTAIPVGASTTSSEPGIYSWDNVNGIWRGLKTNADTVDGKHAEDFVATQDLLDHTSDTANPHAVTASQVGAAPLSHTTDSANPHSVTAGQVGAILDDSGTVTEAHLNFDPATQIELSTHTADASNPHSVTASQTGAIPSSNISQVARLEQATSQDATAISYISWNATPPLLDSAFSHNGGDTLTIQETGTYQISLNLRMTTTSTVRTVAPDAALQVNGTNVVRSSTGYTRGSDGHQESSQHFTYVGAFAPGDTIRVRMYNVGSDGNHDTDTNVSNLNAVKLVR